MKIQIVSLKTRSSRKSPVSSANILKVAEGLSFNKKMLIKNCENKLMVCDRLKHYALNHGLNFSITTKRGTRTIEIVKEKNAKAKKDIHIDMSALPSVY